MKYIIMQDHIKIIILSLILALLSGCSINYNINIDENLVFDEKIIINEVVDRFFDTYLTSPYDLTKHYKTTTNKSNEQITINLDNSTNSIKNIDKEILEYLSFNHIKYETTYEENLIKVNIIFNEEFVEFLTDSPSEFALIEQININICSYYYISSHNASRVNNKCYTWNITEENVKDNIISFEINTNAMLNKIINLSWLIWVLLGGIILYMSIRFYFKVKNKNGDI